MMRWLPLVALWVGLIVSGCGGGGGSFSTSTGEDQTAESSTDSPGPTVPVHHGVPPKRLVVKDLRVGSGPVARGGDFVRIQYVGQRWAGASYSSSWTYGKVPHFKLGGGPESFRLMPGLDKGVRGMRVGGRREVIVPTRLIYFPGEILGAKGPEATLVFVVDLLGVRRG